MHPYWTHLKSNHRSRSIAHLIRVRPYHTSCTSKLSASSVQSTETAYRSARRGRAGGGGMRSRRSRGSKAPNRGACSRTASAAQRRSCSQHTPPPPHPARPAGCTGPRSAAPAACPGGGPPGRRWCSARPPPSPACRPAARQGQQEGRTAGPGICGARAGVLVPLSTALGVRATTQAAQQLRTNGPRRRTWRTKNDTSAMWTPTSTRRRPLPSASSHRTLSASSTSVQPGGSMLRGQAVGQRRSVGAQRRAALQACCHLVQTGMFVALQAPCTCRQGTRGPAGRAAPPAQRAGSHTRRCWPPGAAPAARPRCRQRGQRAWVQAGQGFLEASAKPARMPSQGPHNPT